MYYDRKSRPSNFTTVFLFKPADKTGHARKFARPYHGLFCTVANTARVDRPEEEAILVSLDRLRRCPLEVPDVCWPPKKSACGRIQRSGSTQETTEGVQTTARGLGAEQTVETGQHTTESDVGLEMPLDLPIGEEATEDGPSPSDDEEKETMERTESHPPRVADTSQRGPKPEGGENHVVPSG